MTDSPLIRIVTHDGPFHSDEVLSVAILTKIFKNHQVIRTRDTTLIDLSDIAVDVGSVYNHQLCLVNADVHPYYKKSISDWKNEYVEECSGCKKLGDCGGLFSSGVQHGYSKNLSAFV